MLWKEMWIAKIVKSWIEVAQRGSGLLAQGKTYVDTNVNPKGKIKIKRSQAGDFIERQRNLSTNEGLFRL